MTINIEANNILASGDFKLIPPESLRNDPMTLEYLEECRKIMMDKAVPPTTCFYPTTEQAIMLLHAYDDCPCEIRAEPKKRHDWWNQGRKY